MTNQEINERVAKLCGWTFERRQTVDGYNYRVWFSPGKTEPFERSLNYSESLDACREFIGQLKGEQREFFIFTARELDRIDMLLGLEMQWALITLTPLELCEAFLRLKGQWE